MKFKKTAFTLLITFLLSFLLEGINDKNAFIFSNWRLNNFLNIIHLWFIFFTSYFLFSLIIDRLIKRIDSLNSFKLISFLIITEIIVLLWAIIIDLLYLFFYYNVNSLSETTFYEFDLPLALAILTIGSIYFYQINYVPQIKSDHSRKNEESVSLDKIELFRGSESTFIDQEDIDLIYTSNKLTWVITNKHQTFQANQSLTEFSTILSSKSFFRINRQVILSKGVISGFKKLDFQKLEVKVNRQNSSDVNFIVSKYTAPNFKEWLTSSA